MYGCICDSESAYENADGDSVIADGNESGNGASSGKFNK